MHKTELITEAHNLLTTTELSEMKTAFTEWKQNVITSQELKKACIDACRLSLHVMENTNEPAELTMQLYKHAIRETLNLIEKPDCNINNDMLTSVLDNFDLFLHDMFQKKPHSKSSIDVAWLHSLSIQNEYDIQHILASYLKPLYPLSRTEITEDTGTRCLPVPFAPYLPCRYPLAMFSSFLGENSVKA